MSAGIHLRPRVPREPSSWADPPLLVRLPGVMSF